MAGLVVDDVSKDFGAFAALHRVSFTLGPGQRRAIIGPNGAGKTTLFHVIGGQLRPTGGTVRFDGADVTGLPVHERARRGLSRTFQRNNLFFGLAVRENVRLAVQARAGAGGELWRGWDRDAAVLERTDALVERMGLADLAGQRADELSYGDQRRLELAVALAGEPKLLLVDEPTAGTSPAETQQIVELLRALPAEVALLVVEHDMDVVSTLTDAVTVLHHGQVLADGSWPAVRVDPRVQEAYLGAKRRGLTRAQG